MPSIEPLRRSLLPALLLAVAAIAISNPTSAACEGSLSPIAPSFATSQDAARLGARGVMHSTCVPKVESVSSDTYLYELRRHLLLRGSG